MLVIDGVDEGLIVQAAVISGCGVLLTEDVQHDAVFGGLRIVDPFME